MPKRRPLRVRTTTRTYPNPLYKDYNNSLNIKVYRFGQVSSSDEKHMTSNIMYSAAVKTWLTLISVWCLFTHSSSGRFMSVQELFSAYSPTPLLPSWTFLQEFGISRHFNVAPAGFWRVTRITLTSQVWLFFYIKQWFIDTELSYR